MAYDPEDQSHHLVMDLVDHMENFTEFDNVVSLLIEWGLIDADIGAQAPEIWTETKEN
jgi:hypothetical protein